MSVTETLAKFIAAIDFSRLPEEVVNKTKDTILDTLGCGLGGYTLAAEEIKPLFELLAEAGGRLEATVLGAGLMTSCLNTVLINSTIIHTIDFDDSHVPALAHFGCCTVPVALALGEKIRAGGEEVIAAVVAGFEAGGRVARSVMPTHYEHWHSTSTNGTIAAAATAASLLKLNAEETEMTLGIAADQAAGGRYCLDHGDFTKSLHPGMAAFKGMLAAFLAQKGALGPKGFFEYPTGYCHVYSNQSDPGKITENLGSPYEIMVNDFKGFPTILCSHTPVQATLEIIWQNDLLPEDIENISIKIITLPKGQGCNYEPDTPLAARLSIPYCVATAVIEREIRLEHFNWPRISDAKIRALMGKINISQNPELNKLLPAMPAEVEVITKDGKTYTSSSTYPRGSMKNPMTGEELQEKFLSLAALTIGKFRAEKMAKEITRLEEIKPINNLTALFKAEERIR
jgi:2-methylcitrate dehydratase PrpD